MDETIAAAIASGATVADLRALSRERGFRTLLELGIERVKNGDTTPEEMLRVVGEV